MKNFLVPVAVDVNEAGRNRKAAAIDDLQVRVGLDCLDRLDLAVLDQNVGDVGMGRPGRPGYVPG